MVAVFVLGLGPSACGDDGPEPPPPTEGSTTVPLAPGTTAPDSTARTPATTGPGATATTVAPPLDPDDPAYPTTPARPSVTYPTAGG